MIGAARLQDEVVTGEAGTREVDFAEFTAENDGSCHDHDDDKDDHTSDSCHGAELLQCINVKKLNKNKKLMKKLLKRRMRMVQAANWS